MASEPQSPQPELPSQPEQPPKPELPKKKFLPFWTLLLAGAVLVLLLAGALGFGFYYIHSGKLQLQREKETAESQKIRNDLEQAKASEAARVAVAQNRQQEVLAQIKTATNDLAKLLESVVRFSTEAVALRTNAAGQFIAQFPDLVSQARRIYESELPGLPTRDDVVARLEGARRSQQQITENLGTAYNPDADLAVSAQNTALWAEQSLQKSSAFEGYLANLIQQSRDLSGDKSLKADSPMLVDAINHLNGMESGQRLQIIASNTVVAKNIAAGTVADAEAQRIIEDAKIEAARILREANLKVASNSVADSENARNVHQIQDEALKIKLRERAAKPEIKSRLAPYLSPGYFIPPSEVGYDKKPMSYSALRAAGALDPSMKGLRMFISVGINPRNDRPRLSREFQYTWWNSASLQDQAKELQQLMIELGPTFVDMGIMEK